MKQLQQLQLNTSHFHGHAPLFHVDFHGKMNRKTNLNMDLGSVAFWEEHWDTSHKMYNKIIKAAKAEMKKAICNNVT